MMSLINYGLSVRDALIRGWSTADKRTRRSVLLIVAMMVASVLAATAGVAMVYQGLTRQEVGLGPGDRVALVQGAWVSVLSATPVTFANGDQMACFRVYYDNAEGPSLLDVDRAHQWAVTDPDGNRVSAVGEPSKAMDELLGKLPWGSSTQVEVCSPYAGDGSYRITYGPVDKEWVVPLSVS